MTRTLVHRGPDDEGYYTHGPVALGMRRLRIIDLEGGRQPISNEDGTVWVVFNGEIYNYRELRADLEARHTFRTHSDTEVIVHLYEERGLACLAELRGMFAIALWDATARRLLLARDHLGKKPLYYARTPDALWFGSEIKSLLAVPGMDRTLDPDALDDYLALGYIPSPQSIFASIQKLPPGSRLVVRDGVETVRRYWRLGWQPGAPISERDAIEGLRERLHDSVNRRMIADVPLGAFLSGGIDSSTVVLIMSQLQREPVKTFSIGFDEPEYDELPWARDVARAFRTEHYEQVVKPDALALLPELTDAFDEPFGDSSAIPTYLVAKLARQHVTVALSGDGGDEVFAGYSRYRKALLLGRLKRLLLGRPGTTAAAALAGVLPIGTPRAGRLAAALHRAALPDLQRYCAMVGLYSADLRATVAVGAGTRHEAPPAFARAWHEATGLDPLRRLQAVDTETYLPDDILVKLDRTSMAVSLEARCPLLDSRLVEYVASLPTSLKHHGSTSKWLLRRLLAGRVPGHVLTRRKQGFAVPLASWLRNGWREAAHGLLLDGGLAQYFRRPAIETMLAEHGRGKIDHSERLWLLLVFAAWHERYGRVR